MSDADECRDRNRPEYHYFVWKIHVLCHDGESQGLRACALASCIHRHTEFMEYYLPKPKRSNDRNRFRTFYVRLRSETYSRPTLTLLGTSVLSVRWEVQNKTFFENDNSKDPVTTPIPSIYPYNTRLSVNTPYQKIAILEKGEKNK